MTTTLREGKQRARTEEDKSQRRSAILAAARRMLKRGMFDDITVNDVAAAAGLGKASAYTYFPSKESLFLALAEQELMSWLAKLEHAIATERGPRSRRVARGIAGSLEREPALLELLTLLHNRLEINVPDEQLRAFKFRLLAALARSGAVVEREAGLEPGRGAPLLLRTHALAIGLAQLANPPASVRRILDSDPALAAFSVAFERELAGCIEDLIKAQS